MLIISRIMLSSIILIIICLVILYVLWHLIKNVTQLVINSIFGILILFLANYIHLFGIIGKSDIPITWVSLIVCAIAGIPGAILLIILHIAGLL
jgi:hypothetical protein